MRKTFVLAFAGFILLSGMVYAGAYFFDRQFYGTNVEPELYIYPVNSGDEYIHSVYHDKDSVITVGLYDSGFLFHDLHDHGISKDVVVEVFKRMNLKYEIKVMPRARISSMLEEGSLPMSVNTIKTSEREKYGWFVPYFAEKNVVLLRRNINISSEEELLNSKNIKVGIVRGYYYGEYYMGLIEKLKEKNLIVEAKDIDSLFDMFKEDWIQVTFNNPSSFLYYLNNKDIQNVDVMDFAPNEEPLVRCLIFSKRLFSESDVHEFEKVIAEMKDDGTLYNIFREYLSEEEAKKACDF